MLVVLAAAVLLLSPADRTTTDARDGVSLHSDLDPDDREVVFAIVRDTSARATELLESLGVRRKASRETRLRLFAREADYEDWRRRTNDQSTLISSLSYYNEHDLEIVAAWAAGSDEARGQLRRQVARHRCAGCGGELHGAVLGKGQQLRPGASGLRNPARQLVAIGAERAQRLRRVLRSADPDLCHHKARIQNCMGFPLSAGWSMSFHVNRAMRPSTLA